MAEINTRYRIPIYSDEDLTDPQNVDMFIAWLERNHGYDRRVYGNYYKQAVMSLQRSLDSSAFWRDFQSFLHDVNLEYNQKFHYNLFDSISCPQINIKTLDSVIVKAFRKNFLQNPNRPNEPEEGWVLPQNWFSKLNDILRTTIVVKYLDGVTFLLDHLKSYAEGKGCEFVFDYEARENGYYAVHTGTRLFLAMPKNDWEEVTIPLNLEIQITTQLQTLVKDLLHSFYEEDRKKINDLDLVWQWDYTNDRFNTNYLGHIVHYVEGMIVQLRDKQMKQEQNR